MIQKNFPLLYKKQLAIVTDLDSDKILIKYQTSPKTPTGKKAQYAELKVREKDVVVLCSSPLSSLETSLSYSKDGMEESIKEIYELLVSDEETNVSTDFIELQSLIQGDVKSDESYFVFLSLCSSLYFALDEASLKSGSLKFIPRSQEEINSINKKNYEKAHEKEIYDSFIERLKNRSLLPEDSKFMVEVENVALCRTEKSRVMQAIGVQEIPEKAHQLLLDTGIWDITKNPYPTRYGLSMTSAQEGLGEPPVEDRLEVPGIAYAIDNEWSNDPDDAISFDGKYLWVHIADPASSVKPDSSIDKVARNKGTTLYLPEGAVRMLSESCFEDYALGLKEKSRALSFRILLKEDNTIEDCSIFKTIVNVKRLTYKQATEMKDSPELSPLFEIARKNVERRKASGAINIDMPEIHISVDPETKKVDISPLVRYEADSVVCEMMLLAGEGAAHFAYNNRIPFPFVSQEAPTLPPTVMEGLAGQFKLLRCMHKRSVGITPSMHSGLGIAIYSQVTSPLRRYSDLVAHQQLRSYIDGQHLINKDDMLMRISQGDAASIAARKASRYSETHWKLIYLLQNPDWKGTAVCIDKKDNEPLCIIPSLAMQFTLKGKPDLELNQEITVKCEKIDIPTQNCNFVLV